MQERGASATFILVFGLVWIAFGVFGLIDAPERRLLTASQFVAGAIHLVWAFLLWRRSKSKQP